jgi:hypothetical protein
VSAGKTAHSIAIEFFVQIALADVLVNDVAQGWQENLFVVASASRRRYGRGLIPFVTREITTTF